MANSPVQIILNTENFITTWDRPKGGGNKDFYEGNDATFIKHKESLSEQLAGIKGIIDENEFAEVSFAKVILKQDALAKTHRPTSSLFTKETAPVIGGGDLGELYVELTPETTSMISERIMSAEVETRWKINKDGERVSTPSKLRSEVGAIEEIVPYTQADKRNFTINYAIDWLTNPQTGGAYVIELFENLPPRKDWDMLSSQKFQLFSSFATGLGSLKQEMESSSHIELSQTGTAMIGIRVEDSSLQGDKLTPIKSFNDSRGIVKPISKSFERHAQVLNFLDKHPLVKKVSLPPIISRSKAELVLNDAKSISLNKPSDSNLYPKIAIVDGGISNIVSEWVTDNWGILNNKDKDEDHGTFIAGLLISGLSINGSEVCNEQDGCNIIDIDLLPKKEVFRNYYPSILHFFNELETAVKYLKDKNSVRVFNLSLNVEEPVVSDGYSPFARILDKIAEENDVIFVVSVGNTKPNDFRKEWPSDINEALKILASSRNDTIKKPAESSRNLSIAAVNPPNLPGIIPYAPSIYTCRGPGMRVGVKPDLAHVGGCGTKIPNLGFGLKSVDSNGNIVDGCGTSYAAPHVAKTIACIENKITGYVSRETLIGLTIHHALIPDAINNSLIKEVAKHLVGFGVPKSSNEILEGNDYSATLVFAGRIYNGKKMSFNFTWPASLVDNKKCLGHAKLTVVSAPPFDYKYGAEFVRINIVGHLRQIQKNGKPKGRLHSIYGETCSNHKESSQIENSLKWSPIKVVENTFKKGVGDTTTWKLDIEYLTREGVIFPKEGVPFTAILTISDIEKFKPVFNEMRQSLQSLGVQSVDIRTAARIFPRV